MRLAVLAAVILLLVPPSADADVRSRKGLKMTPGSHRWEHWWGADRELYLAAHAARARDPRAGLRDHAIALLSTATVRSLEPCTCRADAVRALTKALQDRAPAVQAAAAASLGRLGVKDAAPAIRALLKRSRHAKVRESALLALGLLGQPGDLKALTSTFEDERAPRSLRAAAAFGLGFHPSAEASTVLSRVVLPPATKSEARRRRAKPLDPYVVVAAATALGTPRARRDATLIQRALETPDLAPAVRCRLIAAAARLRVRTALPAIRKLAVHEHKHVRRAAVAGLGMLSAPGASEDVARLQARTADEDAATRGLAVLSLGLVGGEKAQAHLRTWYETADMRVRPYVSLALGLSGTADMTAPLAKRLVAGSDPSRHAAHALGLGLMSAGSSADALQGIAEYTGCPHQRGVTCLALGLVDAEAAFGSVLELLERTPDKGPRIHAAYALAMLDRDRARTELVRILSTRANPSNRRQSALAIGSLRMTDAVPDLAKALADRRLPHDVRAAAAVALGRAVEQERLGAHARLTVGLHDRLDDDPLAHLPKVL